MALLFLDSFDHYAIADMTAKWTVGASALTTGRNGNAAATSGTSAPQKTFGVEQSTLYAGVAYRTSGLSNPILVFGNALSDLAVRIQHVGDGRLCVSAKVGLVTVTGTPIPGFVMLTNQWYYIEMKCAAGQTDSTHPTFDFVIQVNGAAIYTTSITFATIGTMATVPAFSYVQLIGAGGGFSSAHDDLYVEDSAFYGDISIAALYPNASGSTTQWTPNTAVANYTRVNEHSADGDTSYVSAASTGLTDMYNLDNVGSFAGTIKGVQALWMVKKSDDGLAAVKGQWKSGGTTIEQAAEFFPSASSYLYDIQAAELSLFTGVAWTAAEIDGLELGIKRTT